MHHTHTQYVQNITNKSTLKSAMLRLVTHSQYTKTRYTTLSHVLSYIRTLSMSETANG